jgi:hypothetical protein
LAALRFSLSLGGILALGFVVALGYFLGGGLSVFVSFVAFFVVNGGVIGLAVVLVPNTICLRIDEPHHLVRDDDDSAAAARTRSGTWHP